MSISSDFLFCHVTMNFSGVVYCRTARCAGWVGLPSQPKTSWSLTNSRLTADQSGLGKLPARLHQSTSNHL